MRLADKPGWLRWDHNEHYHPFLLAQIPSGCRAALDVGCGAGGFAVKMAGRADKVVALDRDADTLRAAGRLSAHPSLTYLRGDLFEADLETESFDFISCIAALHHMPFSPALVRLRQLLAPGGVLAVLGLYRCATAADHLRFAAVAPVDTAMGLLRRRRDGRAGALPAATVASPRMSLDDVRAQASRALPGSTVRRHMYHRYSLVYRAGRGPSRPETADFGSEDQSNWGGRRHRVVPGRLRGTDRR